jgi:integrase
MLSRAASASLRLYRGCFVLQHGLQLPAPASCRAVPPTLRQFQHPIPAPPRPSLDESFLISGIFGVERRSRLLVREAGRLAKLDVEAHPHMLRHAAGYMLANEGTDTRLIQDFLGHRDIRHTAHYTAISPKRLAAVRVR